MDVLRAQRREYNDLYRAHQATTTQDALKMDMMLSLLASQNANGYNIANNGPAQPQRRENYTIATRTQPVIDVALPRRANNRPINNSNALAALGQVHGLNVDQLSGFDGQPRHTLHADVQPYAARNSEGPPLVPLYSSSGRRVSANVYTMDAFQFRSPQPAPNMQADEPVYASVADYEFAQRRRAAMHDVPGVCARQVLESPVDTWGLQAILLRIRASAQTTSGVPASATEQGELAPWQDQGTGNDGTTKNVSFAPSATTTELNTPVDTPSIDVPTPTKTSNGNNNRLSIPSAASDESTPYDYFATAQDAEIPVTPTTSAYSDAQSSTRACIIRVSGAGFSDAQVQRLAQIMVALVSQSPLVLRAAFTACESLEDLGAPDSLGQFKPSPRDITVKLLFAPGPGDNFQCASEIFHHLGGCILVKGVPEYELEDGDEPLVENVSMNLHHTMPAARQHAPRHGTRRWRGLMREGIVPPDVPMLGQIFEQRVRESSTPVDRLAVQLRNEYGVDVARTALAHAR